MKTNRTKDWTDALRDVVRDAEMAPSESAWEKLAPLPAAVPKKAWWPYAAVAAVAVAAAGIVFVKPAGTEVLSVPSEERAAATVSDLPATPEVSVETAIASLSVSASGRTRPAAAPPSAADSTKVQPDSSGNREETHTPSEKKPHYSRSSEAPLMGNLLAFEDFDSEPMDAPSERRHLTLGLNASGMGAPAGRAARIGSTSGAYDLSDVIQHRIPVCAGISVELPVSKRTYVSGGLDFSYLKSAVGSGSQELIFAGIPLNFGYIVASGERLDFSVSAGAKAEACLGASLLDYGYKEKAQFSANLAATLRCQLTGPLYLKLSPELVHYFTETNLPTYRTGKPVVFVCSFGLAYKF